MDVCALQVAESQPLPPAIPAPASLSFTLTGFSLFLAHVAQSVEHFLGKEEVIGSNPIVGSKEEVNL